MPYKDPQCKRQWERDHREQRNARRRRRHVAAYSERFLGISWMPGYNSGTNRYTLGGTSYDNNGNLTNDTFHTYAWNVYNQPASIDATQVMYDAQGQVVEMNNTGTITDFVYTPWGRRFAYYVNGSFVGFTVDLLGGLRAGGQTSGAGVQFYSHPD